ncbi:MAG: hypothetical protein JNL90_17270 [Planctomycetes bacterium]|nr:hypothetical protein [Planctomycetota bacterium]
MRTPLLALPLLASAACGGGGGSQRTVAAGPTVTLALDGPAVTDADATTLAGTTSSAAGVVEVTGGGVQAASNDGFATFTLALPLQLGDNAFAVVARDGRGRSRSATTPTLRRETELLTQITASALDPTGALGLVAGNGLPSRLFHVDAQDGARALLSDATRGSGAAFGGFQQLVFTADGKSVLAATINPSSIFVVDARTGDRTQLARAVTFSSGLAHDPVRARAVYTDNFFASTVRAVALDGSGDKVVSDGADGKSPPLDRPGAVAYDPDEDAYLVVDFATDTLLRVDADDGNRKLLTDFADAGSGPIVANAGEIALDAASRALYVHDVSSGAITRVDLTSGKRKLAFDPDPKFGPLPEFLDGLHFEASSGDLIGSTESHFIRYDLVTSERTELARVVVGEGPAFDSSMPFLVHDGVRRELLFGTSALELRAVDLTRGDRLDRVAARFGLDSFNDAVIRADGDTLIHFAPSAASLVARDLDTLEATPVSGGPIGGGPPFNFPTELALDEEGQRCFVVDSSGTRVLTVALASGDRSQLAAAGDGRSVALSIVIAIEWDPVTGRVLLLDAAQPGVIAVDPDSGERTVFADVDDGSMPSVPRGLACLDAGSRSLYATDSNFPVRVVRVDLDDGSRSIVTDETMGRGPRLLSISAIACDPAGRRLFVHDGTTGQLLQIDTASGDRIILSR